MKSSAAGRHRAACLVLVAAAGIAAGPGCNSAATQPFVFTPAMLAGTWTYADQAGDTISVTLAVTDTVIAGTGWATNSQLRALSGGTVTRVPLVLTGWVSPSRQKAHADASSPAVPLLAAQFDATMTDATHLSATWTITLNGAAIWTQTTAVAIPKS